MIVVVSQAWTLDGAEHADGYAAVYREFLDFHRQQNGFRGRKLLRGIEDPTHFTNLRFFNSVADYEELIKFDGYADFINRMGEHLKPYTTNPKEYMEVVIDDCDG